ncbi:class I SAM-dependent methyltransferase [Lacticaseibacillus parakribbianus]|uniref:class I SAM-dependent methyltransferase n=1 Tax=Lacticaseibacillus parakribbianus TaxID=2970927 RepID=UPI0021CB0996|nr:class I SAM-dependent methyltransferase [Lacticaseibacillus parakribbianus]
MSNAHLKSLYTALEAATTQLHKQLDVSYLDCAVEIGDDLLAGKIARTDGQPSQATVEALTALLDPIDLGAYTAEEIREAWQLVLVKAIQVDGIEPNKQVTPDLMAGLATFLVTTFIKNAQEPLEVADFAAGSGNLIYAVMNRLHAALGVATRGTLVDNDESLLAFADMSGRMQQLDVTLYHQDALAQLAATGRDLVVSDLPVGYYPLDERAKQFDTAATAGHSFAHHLLIEQSMRALRPGGLGLFFVPSGVFQSTEANGLTAWLTGHMHFQGLLNLPESLFATAAARKSLLVLQKPGPNAHQAKQVLLGTFPALEDQQAFSAFLAEVRTWSATNLEEM